MTSRTRRIVTCVALATVGVLGTAGIATARDSGDSDHNGKGHGSRYGHHRDSDGFDHYGKLYSKPMKKSSRATGAPDGDQPDNVGPGTFVPAFVP